MVNIEGHPAARLKSFDRPARRQETSLAGHRFRIRFPLTCGSARCHHDQPATSIRPPNAEPD
jgi:hypothetical protein